MCRSIAVLMPMLLQLLLAGRVHSFDLRSTAKRTLQQDCPIPFNTTLDLTGAAALCMPTSATFCDTCRCRLFGSFLPALQSAGIFSQPGVAGNATAATAAVASILTPCGVGFLGQLTAAGVLLDALLSLTSCNNTIQPPCLLSQLCPVLGCNTTSPPPQMLANSPPPRTTPIPGSASILSSFSWLPLTLALAAAGLLTRML
ncbi:hypothetical protein V8C86DRAFT_2462817 [Haematococcus lacustris]